MQRDQRSDSVRNRVREKMKQQESGGGSWAVDVPQDKKLEFKSNTKEKGVCIKRLDFLPYVVSNSPDLKPGEIEPWRNYAVHRNVGPEMATVICLKETFNEPCPVCEVQSVLYKTAETEEDKKAAASMYVKKRSLFNVIDLDDEDKGVQILDISYHFFGKQLKEELDTAPDYKFDSFAELKGGYTLRIRFKDTQFGGRPSWEANRIDFEERDDYKESILKECHDLDSMFKAKSYDELKDILAGRSVRSKKSDDEVEEKRESRREERQEKESRRESKREEKSRREEPEEVPEERTERKPFSKRDETPEEKPSPRRTLARKVEQEKEAEVEKCPAGGKFGVDTDTLDECEDCKIWNECGEAYDSRKK